MASSDAQQRSNVALVTVSPNEYIYDASHPRVKAIAAALLWYSPRFSPKNVPRFYDVSSITERPAVFQDVIDLFVERYRKAAPGAGPTHVLGFDARGFLLGPPIALALGLPFVLLRKAEKSPGVLLQSEPYHKEYAEQHGADTMVLRMGSVPPGARCILIDDLIATGGTAVSGFEVVMAAGASVYEFAAVIGIPILNGTEKIHTCFGGKFSHVPVVTLLHDRDILDSQCGDPLNFPAGQSRVVVSGASAAAAARP